MILSLFQVLSRSLKLITVNLGLKLVGFKWVSQICFNI